MGLGVACGWEVGGGGCGCVGERGENLSSKVNVTKFWTFFFQKTFFTPGSPSCYSLMVLIYTFFK